jgi:hypothetical protein
MFYQSNCFKSLSSKLPVLSLVLVAAVSLSACQSSATLNKYSSTDFTAMSCPELKQAILELDTAYRSDSGLVGTVSSIAGMISSEAKASGNNAKRQADGVYRQYLEQANNVYTLKGCRNAKSASAR